MKATQSPAPSNVVALWGFQNDCPSQLAPGGQVLSLLPLRFSEPSGCDTPVSVLNRLVLPQKIRSDSLRVKGSPTLMNYANSRSSIIHHAPAPGLCTGKILLRNLATLAAAALLACLCGSPARGQTADWAWMGGSNVVPCDNCGQSGIYGTLGVPNAANIPGGRVEAVSWIGANNRLWLFGGYGTDAAGNNGNLNDLWEFNPSTDIWTWNGGSKTVPCTTCGQPGVYGALGTPNAANIPGSRGSAASWTDSSGNLWLFGGTGFDASGNNGNLNDLWEYNPATNEWTWMGGSSTMVTIPNADGEYGQVGVYGTLGTPSAANIPGGRSALVPWVDQAGHVWLFGGFGLDAKGYLGGLNDLWELNLSTAEWTWMGGSDSLICQSVGCGVPGVYGNLGKSNAGNVPGGRYESTSWIDESGNFWLFGGYGYDANNTQGDLNDLWKYSPSTKEWAWMGGNSTGAASGGWPGIYGTLGTPAAANIPGVRYETGEWVDKSGHFWLFGGTGYDAFANSGVLNDLWEFNPSTNEWAWMGGSNNVASNNDGQPGVYGTLGTPAAANIPGGRYECLSWTDSSGNFWLFGGEGNDSKGNWGALNDMWKYQPSGTVVEQTAIPDFSEGSGTYSAAQSVTISDSTDGATIYYTTDGSTPTLNSNVYSGALTVSATETIQAIAAASGYSQSGVVTATYTINIPVPPSFTISGSPVSVLPGATSGNKSTITLAPAGGLTGSVVLTATVTSSPAGAQDPPTLSFGSTTPATITGAGAATAMLTISTTAATSSALVYPERHHAPWYRPVTALLACIVLFGCRSKRRVWRAMLGMLVLLAGLAAGTLGCGGGGSNGGGGTGNPGTTPGNYIITVNGTDGAVTETGTVSLTVQ